MRISISKASGVADGSKLSDRTKGRQGWQPVLWLILVNLFVRSVWLWYMHPPQLFDFEWYYTHAVQIYQGHGYKIGPNETAYWPMGYPYFLSILFHVIDGPSVLAGLVANALLSIATVVLVYLLALHTTRLPRLAFTAGIAYTCLPSQVEWNSVLGSEELFTFLLLLSLYTYLQASRKHWIQWTLLAGFILGVACTVRPLPLLFPFVLLVYEGWVMKRGWRRSLGQSALFGAACLLGICPLTIRNFIAMHHFILVSTNGGVNLWQGTKVSGSYFWSWNPKVNPLLAAGSNEVLANQIGEQAFLQYVLHHPLLALCNGLKKIFFLYWVDWNVIGVTFQAVTPPISRAGVTVAMWLNTVVYWLWMAVAVFGITRVFRGSGSIWRSLALPLGYIIYNTALFAAFPAWDRFRYPLMPLFALFFACGWLSLRGTVPCHLQFNGESDTVELERQTGKGGTYMTHMRGYKELVIAMVRTGIVGYGGGPSIIPLIRYEAVTRYRWIEDEEFAEILAVANALPGPIATKMAAYLGYRRHGTLGGIVAVLAHILPTSLAMVALLGALYVMRTSKVVKGMIAAVDPVIAVMLGVMAYEFAQKSWRGLGKGFAALFGVVAFLLLIVLHVSPAIVVAVFIFYGAFHLRWLRRWQQRSRNADGEGHR